jgi:hypothetical protein
LPSDDGVILAKRCDPGPAVLAGAGGGGAVSIVAEDILGDGDVLLGDGAGAIFGDLSGADLTFTDGDPGEYALTDWDALGPSDFEMVGGAGGGGAGGDPAPEPSTIAIFAMGLLALTIGQARRKKS